MASPRDSTLSQFAAKDASIYSSGPNWEDINEELFTMIRPLQWELNNDIISTTIAAEELVGLLQSHLYSRGVLNQRSLSRSQLKLHRDRAIMCLTNKLAKLKNRLRLKFRSDPSQFLNAVRAHNKAHKASCSYHQERSSLKQERAFKSNPWKFSESVCKKQHVTCPSFSKSDCYHYFLSVYSNEHCHYESLPSWVNDVMPSPDIDFEFDTSPITPRLIKQTLQKCSSSSSPGPDGITYVHLRNLPCTHKFLATLFNKILQSPEIAPPISWFQAEIILIPKNDDPSDPSNFRPIAMTSVIPKLLHKILARKLEFYLLENNIINSRLQKGFLAGINGCMEHIFSICSILDNAIQHGSPLAMSFLDLKNAFGSVSHLLIHDMLHHINLPKR
jgi:hypothetical protein